jgi:hypothetical protein
MLNNTLRSRDAMHRRKRESEIYQEQDLSFSVRALEINTRCFGKDHPFTVASYNNIGAIYLRTGGLRSFHF